MRYMHAWIWTGAKSTTTYYLLLGVQLHFATKSVLIEKGFLRSQYICFSIMSMREYLSLCAQPALLRALCGEYSQALNSHTRQYGLRCLR